MFADRLKKNITLFLRKEVKKKKIVWVFSFLFLGGGRQLKKKIRPKIIELIEKDIPVVSPCKILPGINSFIFSSPQTVEKTYFDFFLEDTKNKSS